MQLFLVVRTINSANFLCRKAAAEGAILLKNNNNLLPFEKNAKIAVFGRMQTSYYRSGTGSGGGVWIENPPCIIDSLINNENLQIDNSLVLKYKEWIKEHPFNDGGGVWAGEPWHQEEMPLEESDIVKAACDNDAAVIIIGRTAGEDHDNSNEKGSYLLTDDEEQILEAVTKHFSKVAVILNIGNIIDFSFVDKYPVDSVLCIFQGGMEGTNALSDLLSGVQSPSGRLTDTCALGIDDYPSTRNFGFRDKNVYAEDIYVGYRYFETFAKDKVRYPFGYGLNYTDFKTEYSAAAEKDIIKIKATVENRGKYDGREVVQVYYSAPAGKLGTPARQLIAFEKTENLKPSQTETLNLQFCISQMASYDDSGVTGHKSGYVLEKGDYDIFVGTDVRNAQKVITYTVPETVLVSSCFEALPPNEEFERMTAVGEDERHIEYSTVKKSELNINDRVKDNLPKDIQYTGDRGIKLNDVYEKKHSMDEFVAQLSEQNLAELVCGEGLNSLKATPGTVGAIGGLNEELSAYGIPVCSVTDGPSGIKIAKGRKVSLVPNGTLLASTWDKKLLYEIFECIGNELKEHEVDALLGPGINIHRSPLCGRNFEYFSEDPYLTGKLAVSVINGIAKSGSFSTVKHFCCNNQELSRSFYNVVVSERALREIYLKPFEMSVKEGKNVLVMTAYNKVNGYQCASSFDLTDTILRKDWKFDGFVMTDWWADCNTEIGTYSSKDKLEAMIRAQNDIYMVFPDVRVKCASILKGLKDGYITIGQLQRCAGNILKWIISTHTFKAYRENGFKLKYPLVLSDAGYNTVDEIVSPNSGEEYETKAASGKNTEIVLVLSSTADVLHQQNVDIKIDNMSFSCGFGGTGGKEINVCRYFKTDWSKVHKVTVINSKAVNISKIIIKQQ